MKLAVVVQRYGEEVIGGSERHAQCLAEKLSKNHRVTVLTSCASDYRTWADFYPQGETELNGVRITRFPVSRKRRWKYFGWRSRVLFESPHSRLDEIRWIVSQGPQCSGLIDWIATCKNQVDVFLFFTYLYYPTFFGLPEAAEKSLLVPTAHDEPALRLGAYRALFHLPRFIAFNSREEREMVHQRFQNQYIPHDVIGCGVELQPPAKSLGNYLLYLGRVEDGKACGELFRFCGRLGLKLKVAGPGSVKSLPGIEHLGTVTEAEKHELLDGCLALVNPSRNESLSLALLEAWAHSKPVIVPADSPVLRGHVERSGGGRMYEDLSSFKQAVEQLKDEQGEAGRRYVAEYYSWDTVLDKYRRALALISQSS
ncbi:MAG: glycosyltransferase family 4 protein [Acidobacteria bacterium]|nr:glycosyltransferase family 4 protein [Acidobacteriota bacterium]